MSYIKKITCALSALLLILSVLSGCSEKDNGSVTTGETTVNETTNAVETTTVSQYTAPEVKDFEGYKFRFISPENRENAYFDVDEMNGDLMNDVIYERNRKVEEAYNIDISILVDESTVGTVTKNVQAGDDFADIALIRFRDLFPVAQQGYLHDWYTVDGIRYDMPWWDQRVYDELEISGKLYTLQGDFSTNDDLSMLVLRYNKTLYENGGFENPYDLVNSGEWIFDRFWEMVTATSRDLDGDGVMTEKDLWGFITEYSSLYYFYTGSGYKSIVSDKNGGYTLTIGTEKLFDIINKILVIGTEKTTHSLICDDGKLSGSYDTGKTMFNNDQGLFSASQLRTMTTMRDVASDYGALPIPKYSEEQESYYNLVSWNDMPATMPITVTDSRRTALILESLAYESSLTVTDTFYNVFLDEKALRDEESKAMFDIIFDSKSYDLDWFASISGLSNILANIGKSGQNNFVSEYSKIEEQAKTKLDTFIADFK